LLASLASLKVFRPSTVQASPLQRPNAPSRSTHSQRPCKDQSRSRRLLGRSTPVLQWAGTFEYSLQVVQAQANFLSLAAPSPQPSSPSALVQSSVSSLDTKTSSASHPSSKQPAEASSSSRMPNASTCPKSSQRSCPLSWNTSTRVTTTHACSITRERIPGNLRMVEQTVPKEPPTLRSIITPSVLRC
jgi:hypothetical protein